MILKSRDKKIIEKWRKGIGESRIRLQYKAVDDEAGSMINAFCSELSDLVPEVTLIDLKEKDADLSEINISPNISFKAVPIANELETFLNALLPSESQVKNIPDKLLSLISDIKTPAVIKIYISPQCPFCPQAAARCMALAGVNPAISVNIIDGILFPYEAAKDKIRSVPTVILNESFRWTGSVNLEELVQVIAERDSICPGLETLRNIINNGKAEKVAEMMVARGKIFPAFLDLLTDIKWNVRLGAMAAFEFLAGKSPDLCSRINVELCNRFKNLNDQAKGDIIYLLGESGDRSVIPFLDSVVNGDFVLEVLEAAKDALKNLSNDPDDCQSPE